MNVDWGKVKQAIERSLHAAEKGERGSLRVHCSSAERMLHGGKEPAAKEILGLIHHAGSSIDLAHAVEQLQKAQSLLPGSAPA